MKMQWILAVVVALGFCATASAETIDDITSLVYHLDASTGVTKDASNVVTSWASTKNSYSFSQGNTSKTPTYVSNAVNNKAAITFSGSTTDAAGGAYAPYASQLITNSETSVKTLIIVCNTTSDNGLDGMWGQAGGDFGLRRENGGEWRGTSIGSDPNDFAYKTNGGSMTINGASTYNQPTNSWGIIVATCFDTHTLTSTALGEYFIIGANPPRPWGGQIAEVAAFSGSLTAAQTNAILSELGTKYGITVSNVPEPTSMAFVLTGGIALMAYAWRKRK